MKKRLDAQGYFWCWRAINWTMFDETMWLWVASGWNRFRMAMKSNLGKKGINIPHYTQNVPGCEWTKSFLKWHKTLLNRISKNVKKAGGEVGLEATKAYMNNLKDIVQDISQSKIWNYDYPGNL